MIFGNLKDIEKYEFLQGLVKEALIHAKENDVINYEAGSHEIDGDRLFLNRVNYTTHTIDGEKLEPSNFLLGEDGNIQYYDIYTNVDQTTHKFPNSKPSRVMVIIKRLTPA